MLSGADSQIAVMVKILEDIVKFYHFFAQCHFNIFFLGFSKHHEYFIFFQVDLTEIQKQQCLIKKHFLFCVGYKVSTEEI